jgi:cytoskeletal protein RodZ
MMKVKRILLVSVSIIGVLIVVLGAVGVLLASNTPVKADEAQTNPPASLSEEQTTIDYDAQNKASFATTKPDSSRFKEYSSDDSECHHDEAIDWAAED